MSTQVAAQIQKLNEAIRLIWDAQQALTMNGIRSPRTSLCPKACEHLREALKHIDDVVESAPDIAAELHAQWQAIRAKGSAA